MGRIETQKYKRGEWKKNRTILIDIYEFARSGHTKKEVKDIFHISNPAWDRRPEFQEAYERGREVYQGPDGKPRDFRTYVYDQLEPELQDTWDSIMDMEEEENGVALIEEMLEKQGEKVRQSIFAHAFVHFDFDANKACKTARVTKWKLDKWVETDSDFGELMRTIHWHKKNFYESALTKAVAKGNTNAIIHANKTLNADRGYNEKLEHLVSGNVQVEHQYNFTLEELPLPPDIRLQIIAYMRKTLEGVEGMEMPLIEGTPKDILDAVK